MTTMTFKAAPWSNEQSTLEVTSSNENVVVSKTDFAMNNNVWNEITLTLTGNGDTKLTFAVKGKRFFLDNITLTKEATTGINIINTMKDGKSMRVYSIDGRYLGKDINALGRGLYIVGGKKIVK